MQDTSTNTSTEHEPEQPHAHREKTPAEQLLEWHAEFIDRLYADA